MEKIKDVLWQVAFATALATVLAGGFYLQYTLERVGWLTGPNNP